MKSVKGTYRVTVYGFVCVFFKYWNGLNKFLFQSNLHQYEGQKKDQQGIQNFNK